MAFEIGDKVLTNTGLYMSGAWREKGLKGKIVAEPDTYDGIYTVKFKGIKELRFLSDVYLIIREKAQKAEPEVPEVERPFHEGDIVYFRKDVTVDGTLIYGETQAEVLEIVPDSNLIVVSEEETGAEVTVAEELVGYQEDVFPPVKHHPGRFDHWGTEEESVPDLHEVKDNPEVQAALALVLERIEEIKALLTQGPRTEVVFNVHPSNGLSGEEVAEVLKEEEPAPEPVFKKAKAVSVGDLLYTEGGAYDKVNRVETKDSGYTSLYGAFGNRIAQVPSGRVVQVLEEVA